MKPKELLQIPEVVEEIKRHLWIESEKAGYDIGFDRAADEWIKRFAKAWLDYHRPVKKHSAAHSKINGSSGIPPVTKRSAKSYAAFAKKLK